MSIYIPEPHAESAEQFYGLEPSAVPNFDGLLEAALKVTDNANGDAVFRTIENGKDVEFVGQFWSTMNRVAKSVGWDCVLMELAIIEDRLRLERDPYFMSLVYTTRDTTKCEVLQGYNMALNKMGITAPPDENDPIVPSKRTYQSGFISVGPLGHDTTGTGIAPPQSDWVHPAALVRRYSYRDARGLGAPQDRVKVLLNNLAAELPDEAMQALFGGCHFVVIPFIRPEYAPALVEGVGKMQSPQTATPGGVLFGFFRSQKAAPDMGAVQDLAMQLSLVLHRGAAMYAIGIVESETRAHEKTRALIEMVGHELKNSITETMWPELFAELANDPTHIPPHLHEKVVASMSRLWLPQGLGAAMRTAGRLYADRFSTEQARLIREKEVAALREEWLDIGAESFCFTDETVEEYRETLRYLFAVLSAAYQDHQIQIVEGIPGGRKADTSAEDHRLLDPAMLYFPPLRTSRKNDYQAPLILASIMAEPVRNALKRVFTFADHFEWEPARRVVYWHAQAAAGGEALQLTIWNEIPDIRGEYRLSSGVVILAEMARRLGIGDMTQPERGAAPWVCLEEERWFRPVVLKLHPQHVGRRPPG